MTHFEGKFCVVLAGTFIYCATRRQKHSVEKSSKKSHLQHCEQSLFSNYLNVRAKIYRIQTGMKIQMRHFWEFLNTVKQHSSSFMFFRGFFTHFKAFFIGWEKTDYQGIKATYIMKSYKQRAENMNILSFAEKGRWKSAFGASVLPLGHHREGLLWVAIHRSLQCGTLAGPHKASQKTGQK